MFDKFLLQKVSQNENADRKYYLRHTIIVSAI